METHSTHTTDPQDIPFKSYYVVWKQNNEEKKMNISDGLNRTMQYGNIYNNNIIKWFEGV